MMSGKVVGGGMKIIQYVNRLCPKINLPNRSLGLGHLVKGMGGWVGL